MPTKKQIEDQIAALTAELENADTDDEIWIKESGGREIKVTGKRATSVLSKFQDLWADEKAGDEEESEEEEPDEKPAGGGGYFRSRK